MSKKPTIPQNYYDTHLGGYNEAYFYVNFLRTFGKRNQMASLKLQKPDDVPPIRQTKIGEIVVKNAAQKYDSFIMDESEDPQVKAPKLDPSYYTEKSNSELTPGGLKQQKNLQICCTCVTECSPKSCACYLANNTIFPATFSIINTETGKVVLKKGNPYGRNFFVICCGKGCSCHPDHQAQQKTKCKINVDTLKYKPQIEIFWRCETMGFRIRTKKAIEGGIIVGEYLGPVYKDEDPELNQEANNTHAMGIISPDAIPTLKKQLSKLFDRKEEIEPSGWGIQGLKKSSLMALASHSCLANMGIIRIAANNMHPSAHRIFYVALYPISPGGELTVNYGHEYLKKIITGSCLCGASICLRKDGRFLDEKDLIDIGYKKAIILARNFLRQQVLKVFPFKDALPPAPRNRPEIADLQQNQPDPENTTSNEENQAGHIAQGERIVPPVERKNARPLKKAVASRNLSASPKVYDRHNPRDQTNALSNGQVPDHIQVQPANIDRANDENIRGPSPKRAVKVSKHEEENSIEPPSGLRRSKRTLRGRNYG